MLVGMVSSFVLLLGALAVMAPPTLAARSIEPNAKQTCSRRNDKPFKPVSLSMPGVGQVRVLALRALRNGVPRALPLTHVGKTSIAWDRPGFRPGSRSGHVLMNAHVWPDGSAIGNRFNAAAHLGKIIKVKGAKGQVQCYRLSKRIFKRPTRRFAKRYYGSVNSRPRLAILTCAGVRRGPGDWSHRSVWFAKPIK